MTTLWTERAAAAERAVVARYLHRVGGSVPATRIGRVRSPRARRFGPWHYWWQAHLLDCLVDAQQRSPTPRRSAQIAGLVRGVRLRNLGRWTNDYYDDIAWFGLAVHRAGPRARSGARAVAAITARLRAGYTDDLGGGIWWRRGDDFKNAPANGPAAILLARTGDVERAAALTDWMTENLVDPDSGLVIDGIRVGGTRETTTYTYCQGVYLGACVELARRRGDARWRERARGVLEATAARLAEPDGVVGGYDDGGDGGLFNGILARYLAEAAVRLPALPHARDLVLASAESVWEHRADTPHGPAFAHDWRKAARVPAPGAPEGDLSVQLSAWMLLEAAARVSAAGRPAG
ncbi:glycoside hydrolase family 76 protein [Pseudonocardia oroxyli]|uniref:Predicted alpha-1,6-mannanase, GH76 family n=1 Tax=Pseudonocardia oroxyli TaxID=366584 RepID=A0A1G7T4T3_PSEOR|nr:glycoside hydrolase family 76 protein [Pseudonocardia oroxyli]SDG30285.1 Predicted alpha-1,6-mannanase, GH76 family [Pseudonocardia oroxyli]